MTDEEQIKEAWHHLPNDLKDRAYNGEEIHMQPLEPMPLSWKPPRITKGPFKADAVNPAAVNPPEIVRFRRFGYAVVGTYKSATIVV